MNLINIVVVEPNQKPYAKEIDRDSKQLNDIVDGYVQNIWLSGNIRTGGLFLACNEDGIEMNLPVNRVVNDDTIRGNFCIVRVNPQGDYVSLDQDDIDLVLVAFSAKVVAMM